MIKKAVRRKTDSRIYFMRFCIYYLHPQPLLLLPVVPQPQLLLLQPQLLLLQPQLLLLLPAVLHPHPQPLLLFELLLLTEAGMLELMPAKNSAFCGGAKISIGKSRFSKNSHGLRAERSSHSSGMQKPFEETSRFTSLKSLIIVKRPIVTATSCALPSASQQHPYLSSAARAIALDSTKINGSAERSELPPPEQNKSVEIRLSVVIEPKRVTFLLYTLLAGTLQSSFASTSLKMIL